MKFKSPWLRPKRLGSLIVIEALLAQAITPAYAVSTGYTGTVSQLPGGYIKPPDTNVMFTLDDSLSMHSDAIPDYLTSDASGNSVDLSMLPGDNSSNAVSPEINGANFAHQFPGMWKAGSSYLNAQYYSAAGVTAANFAGRYLRSSAGNPLYYNPKVRYRPWPKPGDDTDFWPDADPKAVNIHPSDPTNTGRQIDLTVQMGTGTGETPFWPATFFVKTSTAPLPPARPDLQTVGGSPVAFTIVEIKPPATTTYAKWIDPLNGTGRTDCSGAVGSDGCSYTEELKNFANWLQYYRSRLLMAKGGVSAAFAKQGTGVRVGFGTINNTVQLGIRQFSGANRTAFYNQLYPVARSTSGTPLRDAVDKVGKYFQRDDVGNPWAENPASAAIGTEYACRRSFHILSTDGFWNGNAASGSANNNNDQFSGATPAKPDGTTFTYSDLLDSSPVPAFVSPFAIAPFSDGNSGTLADVAAYYWKTDLRSSLANSVATSARDPAFWQHLTMFTVGLGITGTGLVTKTTGGAVADIASPEGREKLVADRTPLTWTTPSANDETTGDDLIHAAMNGRGRYFSATDPTTLSTGLASALSEAADNVGDFASVAADSPQLSANGNIYQATFSPARWYGRLYSFQQSVTGVVNNKPTTTSYTNPTQVWEASNKMPSPAQRNIYTSSGTTGSGATFTWTGGLTTAQKGLLGTEDVLNYLRGDASQEVANKGTFRDRTRYAVGAVTGGVLGDVVNATPLKGPDAGGGYQDLPSADTAARSSYVAYRSGTGLDNMRNSMYLGSNDGMLHAFNLTDGIERFAYVPNAVYEVPRSTTGTEKKMQLLATDLTGAHRYTVDGPPNISDAFLDGAWKTILTSSNGAGARGVFAIDVTNPVVGGTGGFDASKVMWEFTEANNADMGYMLAYPHVVRMADTAKTWAVIFGNGYDSTNGQAKLFILKLSDGSILREIPVGAAGNNGLSQPNFIVNDTREVTTIYAGDLKGNLWKFDVSDPDSTKWAPSFGAAPNYSPLFTAISSSGVAQPISVMPEITANPNLPGSAMLTFGTGKLFETSDTAVAASSPANPATDPSPPNVNLATNQSIYGIWDKPSETTGITITAATRSSVLQSHSAPTIAAPAEFGATSSEIPSNSQRGWFIDLAAGGERVNLTAQQVRNVLFVVANTPVSDPCANGGTSRLFALDPVTGAIPKFPVFDVNKDGVIKPIDDSGFNVKVGRSGLLTQPIFQFISPSTTTVGTVNGLPDNVTPSPASEVDVGQATSARQGGKNLLKGTKGSCGGEVTAAQTDTTIMTMNIKVCDKARISWRQLQ
jgi:type IV pilus assembly protein PilY1